MAHVTVGVLGHVDHGKTSLVRALTGIETDRLREEKERGLSIVLGYAWLESEKGVIDFIDVPGHEDFIRMMIAGSTGIDYTLLLVAANEGIKPQTEEHFNIAGFLGIHNGLVVITKSDLVSRSKRAQVRHEIRNFTEGTFMRGAQIVETSIDDERSIGNLRGMLEKQLLNPTERKNIGKCYLPLDRVFTMAGFGVVATGTLRNGDLADGQEVEIMPRDSRERRVRIRRLQVHNQPETTAHPGQRVAVNLRNVNREMIARGDALVSPGYLRPTRLLDVELQLVDRLPRLPKYGEAVRVLFGTCEVSAQLRILGHKRLEPGSTCMAQFVCRRDVAAPVGERFIVRAMSPVTTIGGGRILDNAPVKHRRSDQDVVTRLQSLASNNAAEVIQALVHSAGSRGISMAELSAAANIPRDEPGRLLDEAKIVFVQPQQVMSKFAFDALCDETLTEIGRFHKENPNRTGQPLSELRSRLRGDVDEVVFRFFIEYLDSHDLVRTNKNIIRLSEFNPLRSLDVKEQKLAEEIIESFKSGGLKPPELAEVLQDDPGRKRLYHLLTETGELVPIHNRVVKSPPDKRDSGGYRAIVFHRLAIKGMVRKLEQAYPAPDTFTVADVRKLVDTSRKFAIPLLEHLDSLRVTLRVGDKRKLLPNFRDAEFRE